MKTLPPTPHDKYLATVEWALRRYKRSDGSWIMSVGNGVAGLPMVDGKAFTVPSRCTVIEDLAAERYLSISRYWTGFNLANCYQGGRS